MASDLSPFISLSASAALTALYVFTVYSVSGAFFTSRTRHAVTLIFTRTFIFAILFSAPVFRLVSGALMSLKWAYYAEAEAIISSAVLFTTALMLTLQRFMAIRFDMDPAFEVNEALFLGGLAVTLYASYTLTGNIMLYFLSPGVYSVYLLMTMALGKPARA